VPKAQSANKHPAHPFYRWKALLSNAFYLPKRSFASLYSLVVNEKVPKLLKAPSWWGAI